MIIPALLSLGAVAASVVSPHAHDADTVTPPKGRFTTYSTETYHALGVLPTETIPDEECWMETSQDGCSLENFNVGDIVKIYPGGNTACMDYDSPFGFAVRKGDPKKVIFYFSGGGACWNQQIYDFGLCKTESSLPPDIDGIFAADENSKFKDYTSILVTYCSGDIFLANGQADFVGVNGSVIMQTGAENARATLNWLKAQMHSGSYLGEVADELVIGGISAGALGGPVWSNKILRDIKAKETVVIADSFVNPMPTPYQGALLNEIGDICKTWDIVPTLELRVLCKNNKLTINDLIQYSMRKNPRTTFAFIQAKFDAIQVLYYNAVLGTFGQAGISANEYYDVSLDSIRALNEAPNFVIYLSESTEHGFLNYPSVFTTDAKGACGNACSAPTIGDWVEVLPLYDGNSIQSICDVNTNSLAACDPEVTDKIVYYSPEFNKDLITTFNFGQISTFGQTINGQTNVRKCTVLKNERFIFNKKARLHINEGIIVNPAEYDGTLVVYLKNHIRLQQINFWLSNSFAKFALLKDGEAVWSFEQDLYVSTEYFSLMNHDGKELKGKEGDTFFEAAFQLDLGRLRNEGVTIDSTNYVLEIEFDTFSFFKVRSEQCVAVNVVFPAPPPPS